MFARKISFYCTLICFVIPNYFVQKISGSKNLIHYTFNIISFVIITMNYNYTVI